MTQQTLPTRRRANKPNCYKSDISFKDHYKFFVKKFGTAGKTGVTKRVFGAVVDEFLLWVRDELIKGEKFFLPFGLGTFEVVGKKAQLHIVDNKVVTKYLKVDWPATWEYWSKNPEAAKKKKVLYYTNEHSDGYTYRLKWDKPFRRSNNINYYSFKTNRILSRALKGYIKDTETPKNFTKC